MRALAKVGVKPVSNVIPFPVGDFSSDRTPNKLRAPRSRTFLTYEPADYAAAVTRADSGDLRAAADFCDWIFRDGRVRSAIEQATGWLGLPIRFECDPDLAASLVKDSPKIFPEAEQGKLWMWGYGFGVGVAREVWTFNHLKAPRCVVETWHPRDLVVRRERDDDNAPCDRWYIRTESGEVLIDPGSGWLLFTPYGRIEPWRFGLWNPCALPVLAKWQAVQDRTRTSEVTPILVAMTKGLSEPQRKQLLADMRLSEDTRMVLPKDCDIKAVDVSSGVRGGIQKDTIEWADGEITTVWLGQTVTTDGASGFSNGDQQSGAQEAISRKRETAWSTAMGEQFFTPYARIVHGYLGEDDIYPRWLGAVNAATPVETPAGAPSPVAAEPVTSPTGSPPANDVAPAAVPDVAASEVTDDATHESAEAYARDLTEAQERTCEHGRVNGCTSCGVKRERGLKRDEAGEIMRDAEGRAVHEIRWRPIRPVKSPTASSVIATRDARRMPGHVRTVTHAALGDEPPTEFLIFGWGENQSSKGSVWLQEPQATELFRLFGSPDKGMIDLEHLSLGMPGMPHDPDARGWFVLRLDDRGLWATDIKWTEDGERRIRGKLQRFTSPAFNTKSVDGKEVVTELVNVALTALPATRYITPLVAASVTATRARGPMDDTQTIAALMFLFGATDNDDLLAKARAKVVGEPVPEATPENAPDPAAAEAMGEAAPDALTALRAKAAGDPAMLGALAGLEQSAGLATKALSRVEAIEKAQEDAERSAIFAAHRNKFDAHALKAYATKPIAELRSFVQFASPIAAAAMGAAPAVRSNADLSPREVAMFKGRPEADMKAYAERKAAMRSKAGVS